MECKINVFINDQLVAEYKSIEEMKRANLYHIDESEVRRIRTGDTYELRLALPDAVKGVAVRNNSIHSALDKLSELEEIIMYDASQTPEKEQLINDIREALQSLK